MDRKEKNRLDRDTLREKKRWQTIIPLWSMNYAENQQISNHLHQLLQCKMTVSLTHLQSRKKKNMLKRKRKSLLSVSKHPYCRVFTVQSTKSNVSSGNARRKNNDN